MAVLGLGRRGGGGICGRWKKELVTTAAGGRSETPPLVTSCATFRTTVTAASLTGALRWGARAQRVRGVSDGIQGDTLLFDGLQQLCYLFII